MEHEIKRDWIPVAILVGALVISAAIVYVFRGRAPAASPQARVPAVHEAVSSAGTVLPAVWGNLGSELKNTGVIDAQKFEPIGDSTERLVMTPENAGRMLNSFWALGLGNENPILESEMRDPKYGGANRFASTAGWTIAQGDPMMHYGKHRFVPLTAEQQKLVDDMSRGIYRPCCGNSTHFPDCNHGMAMLGLLELMASQGASEQDMWKAALAVNSYWFPDTYQTIRTYMEQNGTAWKDIDPKEVLGAAYSSSAGYRNIAQRVASPRQQQNGGGCSV